MLICCVVMNNPELPLDPNLQTSNLLITFLKYASIVMQDTKGKPTPSCPLLHQLFYLFIYLSVLSCPLCFLFTCVSCVCVCLQMSIDSTVPDCASSSLPASLR